MNLSPTDFAIVYAPTESLYKEFGGSLKCKGLNNI